MNIVGRLEITTKIGCSINCVYCPQKLLMGKYFAGYNKRKSMLSYDDFKTCIDKLPQGTRIDFSGMAEPWLNKACTDMVCYAAEKGFKIAIYTTLVGMNKTDFNRIKDIDFEEFVLHVPDDKSNAHIDISQAYIDLLQEVVEYRKDDQPLVTGFSCHAGIHPAIAASIPANSKLITELINRAGNIESDYVVSKENEGEILCVNCGENINHNVLLPDGTIVLCCMDYGMEHVLGNLLEQGYEDILYSEEAKKVRDGLKGKNNCTLCRNCTNARTIYELYNEFELYRNWVKTLQSQSSYDKKDLKKYKEWVANLENQAANSKKEIKEWENRYDDRINELSEYKEWVENLKKQQQNEKDVYHQQCNDYEQKLNVLAEQLNEEKKQLKELQEQLKQLHELSIYGIYKWKKGN